MKILPLNKIDVSHRSVTDPGIVWLVSCGYRFDIVGNRVYLVRSV